MRKPTNVLVTAFLCTYAAQAHALYLYNRSGGTLCIAETRDEPEPFDQDVSRITKGWQCVDNLDNLEIERSDGILDIAVKRAYGSDYVASSCLQLKKTKVFIPKDDSITAFGMEILRTTPGWVAYSWFVGEGNEWSNYQTLRNAGDLPAALDVLGFKEFEAWQLDAQQNGLGYLLY